jgi:hypothetical protein
MEMTENEEAIIQAFIIREKRKRYLDLFGSKKRRADATDCLNHFWDLDPRYSKVAPSTVNIVGLLQAKGAPDTCCVISAIHKIDGRTMPLQEAIDIIEYEGWGTLVGCVPGHLAYYYGEQGEQRLILEKT